jgi:hydroxymethylbilane synthase
MRLRLGARGSALSLAQAALVSRAVAELAGVAAVEIVEVRTTGDRKSAAGEPISWKGDFTRELDEALRSGAVDFAVHSLKDVPSTMAAGLVLAAVPLRQDPRDALVSHPARRFADLPAGARVGTSSPRRRAQLLAARPDLEILEARGNVDTRIRRLREGRWDAIVLARAGLARLGRLEEIVELFPEELLLPAVGQGALALAAREDDARVREILAGIDDAPSHAEVICERALLARLEAGCRAPVAARARASAGALAIDAAVFSADGARVLRGHGEGATREAERVGREVGDRLLAAGAGSLIGESGA